MSASRKKSDWPELDKAIEERRLAQPDDPAQAAARRAAGEFGLRQHDPRRYERMEQLHALFDEWNAPVCELLRRVARAAWPEGGFTLRAKLIDAEHNRSHALYWEAEKAERFTRYWFTVALELDAAYQPAAFWVECARPRPGAPPERLRAAPELEALRATLAEAFTKGPFNYRSYEKPGWTLRREMD